MPIARGSGNSLRYGNSGIRWLIKIDTLWLPRIGTVLMLRGLSLRPNTVEHQRYSAFNHTGRFVADGARIIW